jgi:two-component system chemotaxis response regulator CheY
MADKPTVKAPEEVKFDSSKDFILILEDSSPNLNILKRILEKCGFGVLAGADGKIGVDLLQKCKTENLKLVAIISDIMMPNMDGHQFLGHVKAQDRFKETPFVFLTALGDKQNVLEAKKLGVDGYLLKPITMDKIRAKLKDLFPKRPFPYSNAS